MDRESALDRVRTVAARIASDYGLEIFDVQFRREAVGWVLRIVLDRLPAPGVASEDARPGAGSAQSESRGAGPSAQGPHYDAVGIDDCRRVSEELSARLDVDDLVDAKYTLEVSSPGLDRPLRGEADFRRFVGRLAKVVTTEPLGAQSSFAGRIAGVEDGVVQLDEGRRRHRVPLALVKRARLEVEL